MTIVEHVNSNGRIAEIVSDEMEIRTAEDATDLLGNIYYQGFDSLVIKIENLSPDFFDLKNGMAGEILQKFSNYRVGLVIVGDYSKFSSTSVKDFIRESNRKGHIRFADSISGALEEFAQ